MMNKNNPLQEIPPNPPRTPQSFTLGELRNRITRRQFLQLIPAALATAAATAITPDFALSQPAFTDPVPEWEEGNPIPVEGSHVQLIGINHQVKLIPQYEARMREKIRKAPFVFLEYFDEYIRPEALPTTPNEELQNAETFGDSVNKFYASVGKICAEEGKDVIVVNPETITDRYVLSFLASGLAAGTAADVLLHKLPEFIKNLPAIIRTGKSKIPRRAFLKGALGGALLLPAAVEAAAWSGQVKAIQTQLALQGIVKSDLSEKERAMILGWSLLDWRDIGSDEGIEKALSAYKNEIVPGNLAVAFNGAQHQGMAEYLIHPERREEKKILYPPYILAGDSSVRRYHYNPENNIWELKDQIRQT